VAVRFSEDFAGVPLGQAATLTNTSFSSLVGTGTLLGVAGTFGRAVRMDTDGTAATFGGLRYEVGATAPTARFYRGYVTPRRLPNAGAGHMFFTARAGGTISGSVRILDTGFMHLRNGATNQTAAGQITTAAVGVGELVRVEYTQDTVALTHTARIFRGAGVHGTTPTETLTAPLTTAGTSFTIGSPFDINAAMDFEQIVAEDAAFPTPLAAPVVPETAYVLETWGAAT
jgi:hypothetical protein